MLHTRRRRRHRSITPDDRATHTHTHTTIFPSRLPTFRHLPRTTAAATTQSGHRRVIAARRQQQQQQPPSQRTTAVAVSPLPGRREEDRERGTVGRTVRNARVVGNVFDRVYGSLYREPVFPPARTVGNGGRVKTVLTVRTTGTTQVVRTTQSSRYTRMHNNILHTRRYITARLHTRSNTNTRTHNPVPGYPNSFFSIDFFFFFFGNVSGHNGDDDA